MEGQAKTSFVGCWSLSLVTSGFCNPFDEFHNGCFALLRVISKTFLWGYPFGCAYKSIVCNMVGLEEGKLQHNMMQGLGFRIHIFLKHKLFVCNCKIWKKERFPKKKIFYL
jgi:hypothetical protein